jgi:S-adenosylmethionine:tRNA ribosyltransferase-isomerase
MIGATTVKLRDFHYPLPPERVAREPLAERDAARLLVCSRTDPSRVEHRRVRDLPELLRPGDVVVLNETRVLAHRLVGARRTGARVECLVLRRSGREAVGFLRPSARLRPGEILAMEGGALHLRVLRKLGGGRHDLELLASEGGDLEAILERVGRAPLPPYLQRRGDEDVALDRQRYQTVFARAPGAVAAPTAGLHFTPELLARLETAGVGVARLTLHVGEGTFEPVRCEEVEDHRMHAEEYELGEDAARAIEAARAGGGRVVAVGTTSARVLETCHDATTGRLRPGRGETRLFLYPGRGPRFVDVLLTNFHLPESTLLLLVASILGRERTLDLYRLAIEEGYRFYSFGDAMLILPDG